MATASVRDVIALASELTEEERRVVVDAIAPKESVAELAREWQSEIERRAVRVRSGDSGDSPRSTADAVFARVESKLPKR